MDKKSALKTFENVPVLQIPPFDHSLKMKTASSISQVYVLNKVNI